jgi:hypothetical protein
MIFAVLKCHPGLVFRPGGFAEVNRGSHHRNITPAIKYFTIVIVRLDRTIQNLLKKLDSPIKSGNDRHNGFIYFFAGVIKQDSLLGESPVATEPSSE